MEKKVTKKFYYLSALNLITVGLLGQGHIADTAVLFVILIALVVNHTFLIKIIRELTNAMKGGDDAQQSTKRLMGYMLLKFMILGGILGLAYFYNQALVAKVMILMIFQLIIQVVSIKNNY